MVTELLQPCPFCGGKPELTIHMTEDHHADVTVHCRSCQVTMAFHYLDKRKGAKGFAIAKWNTRYWGMPKPKRSNNEEH